MRDERHVAILIAHPDPRQRLKRADRAPTLASHPKFMIAKNGP